MTTPGKNFPALPAFLPTPDSIPETSACRTFSVPDNDDWLGLLMGALNVLSQEWAYYPYGSVSAEDAAQKWNEIIIKAYADSMQENNCTVVTAPFWDDEDGDDADDEASEDDQPWYGFWDGETFIESLSYIIVTAFLATIVGETGAVQFVTPLRQFRITLRTGPHGATVRLLMDSNLFQLIDLFTATEEVKTVTVISPGSTLMLVHSGEHNPSATPDENGNYTVDIIKSRLSESDVTPPDVRYVEEADEVQFSPDGGTTWYPMPSLDPRHSTVFLFPELGTDVRCDAAANMVKWIRDFIDLVTELLGAGATALAVANAAIPLYELITGGTLTLLALLTELGAALFGIGDTALLAAFDEDTYAALLCCFYCHISANGQVSAGQLVGIEAQVTTDLNTTAGIVVNAILFMQGEVGLSNAGAIGSETGDCSECECAWCYDLTLTEESLGFEAQDVPPWGVEGAWSDGWIAVSLHDVPDNLYQTVMHIYGALPEANYTKITVNLSITLGELDPDIHFLKLTINGGGSGSEVVESFAVGEVPLTWLGNKTGSDIDIRVEGNSAFGTIAVISNPGAISFATIHFEGQGANPFGDDNCVPG